MNDKTGGNKGRWDAGVLAVAAAVAVIATACGGSAPSATVAAAAYTQEILVEPGLPSIGQLELTVRQARQEETRALPELRKYFRCVHSRGGPAQAALLACRYLLPPGTHASLNTAA
jgi:hypothetical protein